MTSEIRANTLKNRVGLGTVSYTNTGIVVSGIVTANSFSGPLVSNGDITGTGNLTLTSTDAGSSASPIINLFRNSASPADADYLGQIKFQGESDTGVQRNYAKITGKILDASNGTEDGILEFAHIKAGSQTITGRWRSDSLQLLNGTNLSVAGDTTLTGDIDVDGHTNLDNVSIAGVSTVYGHGAFGSTVDITGDLAISDIIKHIGDSNTKIRFPSSDTFTVETAGNERFRVTDAASTFQNKLIIDDGSNGHLFLNNTSSENTIHSGTTGFAAYKNLVINAAQHTFKVSNTEKLRILSDGTIRGGSQVAAQPSPTVAGFQFDAGGEYLRISKGGGATGTSGAGISLIGGGSNTNHLATTSWGSNIYLINSNQVDNNANALVFANKNSLASSMIVGKNDSHASRNGSLIFATSHGSSPTQRMRITKEGSINIGTDSTQSTHMLYMQGTGSVGIHLRADTDNSGENDNPYISMGQDGSSTQQLKLGMAGDANADFNMQITNSPFLHANNGTSQPLQLAHMSDMAVTISSVSGLGAGGQSATDPRDFDSDGSLAGNAVGGMKIHHYGNDTAAALMLSGHNNTGTPGTETRTQLTHTGANLRFHIEHHGYEAFNISPTGNIYLKNCTTIPSFTTSYNVSALSLRGGSLMNYQESNIYVTQNLHYDGAWKNTYSGAGSMISQGGGTGRYYYFDDPGSAGQSVTLVNSIDFKNQSSASGMSYGNRPSSQGQLVLWGPSHATQKGGLEFHTSGGGGAGYGGRITCSDQGHIRFLTRHNNSGWGQRLIINASSGVVSGDLNDTSDIALKKNIVGISTSCIDNIKKLNPVTFEWKTDDGGALIDGVKNMGFVAQEVEKIIPEVVKGEDGQKAINVTGIVAQLTKALQESITKIETLEAKVAALEGS